ncbi:thioredoxin family protein [Acaryochloris sp. CCMEE 5410]|uniref:thioredoxin family protein n=1 Tax=Acaryochloris sp. CCMEE 5410 TaxID=310037 RepID=UPI0002483EE4|nr:thioredoxin family protein [Acaryochloris sp. CCMEE 5410]KAI9130082.1 thioredoxin family protein [Acaryochloris sp. CCMEE 5410]
MAKRSIEVFTAGCPLCDSTVELVRELAAPDCQVKVWDLHEGCETNECQDRAAQYGIHRLPAVVVDGQLAECCQNQRPISRESLIASGIG